MLSWPRAAVCNHASYFHGNYRLGQGRINRSRIFPNLIENQTIFRVLRRCHERRLQNPSQQLAWKLYYTGLQFWKFAVSRI